MTSGEERNIKNISESMKQIVINVYSYLCEALTCACRQQHGAKIIAAYF